MSKILKIIFIGLIVCVGILYLHVYQGFADSEIAIANHVMAYSITRNGENYYLKGPVVDIASKKISDEIQILDVIMSKPKTFHMFTVLLVDAKSNTPVSIKNFERSKSDTGLYFYVTVFNISNKPAGDYYILVAEDQIGVIGRFMLRIK